MGLSRGGTHLGASADRVAPITFMHTHQAPTIPSPGTRCQDPFPVPTPRDPRRPERDITHLLQRSLSSLPHLLYAPVANYCLLLSSGKTPASPPHLAVPHLAAHPAEVGCPRTGSRAHPQPCLDSPGVLRRQQEGRLKQQALPARQGCFWPACLTQGWGVCVLRGGRSPTSSPNPIPYLSRGAAGGCGAGYGENWSMSAGEESARAEIGLPKAPSLSRALCTSRPVAILPARAGSTGRRPPTWLQAEPSTNWSCVSFWPCSGVISA